MVGAVIGAAVSVGTSILGAKSASKAAKKSAQIQADAANNAIKAQQQQAAQAREDQKPYLDAGRLAQFHIDYLQGRLPEGYTKEDIESMVNPTEGFGYLNQTFDNAGIDYKQDPAYQNRLEEGQQAIERSAAARGGLLSGATQKRLNEFAQEMASNEYAKAYNRYVTEQTNLYNSLASQAGLGQKTASLLATNDRSVADQVGNYGTQGANATAAGVTGSANAWQSGLASSGATLSNFFNKPEVNKWLTNLF